MPEPLISPDNGAVPNVTVTVGQVSTEDGLTHYSVGDDVNGRGIHTDFRVRNRYEGDHQIYMIPLTTPIAFQGETVAFCQLAAKTLLWIAEWTACRYTVKPRIPSTSVDGWILLDEHLELGTVTVTGDGITPLYRISGVYVFGHTKPTLSMYKYVQFAKVPWIDNTFDRQVTEAMFQNDLLVVPGKKV